jgi:hypothetical protein
VRYLKYRIPQISVTEAQKSWIDELYSQLRAGLPYQYRYIRAKLFNILPDEFDPKQIDQRLVNGGRLTVLGIMSVDPESNILEICDKIIRAIRDELINDPTAINFSSESIAKKIEFTDEDVRFSLGVLSSLGRFWSSSTGSGFSISSINTDHDDVFDEYLNYKGMEDLLDRKFPDVAPMSDQLEINSKVDTKLYTSPVFQSQIANIDLKLCFVLMPFGAKWSDRVYTELIRKVVESLGLQCLRADNLKGRIIIEDIWTKINQSAFIIADVTGRNPNVMYEVGIAHAIGKPTILLTQEISKIPFDFSHLRHDEYADNVESFRSMELKLPLIIKDLYEEVYKRDLSSLL